jgi:hypothetical protein
MINSQHVGRINRKRFITTEETVLDILNQRLKGEKDICIRNYIRQKISLFSEDIPRFPVMGAPAVGIPSRSSRSSSSPP